jgi:hypothetical protein
MNIMANGGVIQGEILTAKRNNNYGYIRWNAWEMKCIYAQGVEFLDMFTA